MRKKLFVTSIFIIIVALTCGVWVVVAGAASGLDSPIEIYLNGSLLESDVPPVLKDDRTFVPIRVIGEALGYVVDYDDGVVTMRHDVSGATIEMAVGIPFATINGKVIDLPVPAFIESDRTLAPVRFLSEALDSNVIWEPGYYMVPDRVIINCPYPVDTLGGKVKIASRLEKQFWELESEDFGPVDIGYDLNVPVLTIPDDKVLERKFNDEIFSFYELTKSEIRREYAGMAEDDEYVYGRTDECNYFIVNDDSQILTVNIEGYAYFGGAHGMPYIISYNLDLEKGLILTLADIFKPDADYESILIQRMTAMCNEMPDLYEDVEKPDFLEDGSFYFANGELVIYYQPYALSYFANGFVKFHIPIASLAGNIRDEYR